MATCEQCGNDYAHAFVVTINGRSHSFDSFACAITRLAPRCSQCENLVIGHGVESADRIYCSAHCAHQAGFDDAVDHVRPHVLASPA